MKHEINIFFMLYGLCSFHNTLASDTVENNNHPNVLFIAVDDMNDWAGCLRNHPGVKTPNIDRLAESGMIFTNAHCQAPISGPSRTSIMTGLYPHSTGVYLQLSDTELKKKSKRIAESVFLPDYFEQFGYKTIGVGKLFHNGDNVGGFDEYGGFYPNGSFHQKSEQRMNYNPEWFTKTWRTITDWGPLDNKDSDMPDYQIAEWAISQINKKHESPFFMGVGFILPHTPWQLPKKWFDLFPESEMVTPPYLPDDMDDIPEISKMIHDMPQMPTTEWLKQSGKWKSLIQSYLASLAFVDTQIGKVIDALRNSEYADNTIIALFSDHGYHMGEKNRTCKHSLWERSTHVPLIFSGPGIKSGQAYNKAVGLIDIYPTLIDLCGIRKNVDNEGISLKRYIDNPNLNRNEPVYCTYGKGNTSVYLDNYHLISYEDGSCELYDMSKDPNEWYNLANNIEYCHILSSLRECLPKKYEDYIKQSKFSKAANLYFNKKVLKEDIPLKIQ